MLLGRQARSRVITAQAQIGDDVLDESADLLSVSDLHEEFRRVVRGRIFATLRYLVTNKFRKTGDIVNSGSRGWEYAPHTRAWLDQVANSTACAEDAGPTERQNNSGLRRGNERVGGTERELFLAGFPSPPPSPPPSPLRPIIPRSPSSRWQGSPEPLETSQPTAGSFQRSSPGPLLPRPRHRAGMCESLSRALNHSVISKAYDTIGLELHAQEEKQLAEENAKLAEASIVTERTKFGRVVWTDVMKICRKSGFF